jgi:uncharacterized protein involved in outer membrane biogenesis
MSTLDPSTPDTPPSGRWTRQGLRDRLQRAAPRWGRRLAWAVGGLLVVWAVAWLAAPPILKHVVEARLTDLLGRPTTVRKVDFLPWTLEVTLHDLTVGAAPRPGGAASAASSMPPLLHVKRMHFDNDWSSLFRLAPVVKAVDVDAPSLHVARTAAGHYDFDDVLAHLAEHRSARGGPLRFAFYNVQLRDGGVIFDDRPVGRRHEVSGMLLTLPFVSSLPSQLDVNVEPRLAFTLDGTAFDTGARSTPFERHRDTLLHLHSGDVDLVPLKPYLPADLPVVVQRGRVQADVSLHFVLSDSGQATVTLRGNVRAFDFALGDRAGATLASGQSLQVELEDVEPLLHHAAFGTIRAEGLVVAAARDAAGGIDLARLIPAKNASAAAPATSPPPEPWRVGVHSIQLSEASVAWNDAAVQPRAAYVIDRIEAKAGPVAWPASAPVPVSIEARLRAAAITGGTSVGAPGVAKAGKVTAKSGHPPVVAHGAASRPAPSASRPAPASASAPAPAAPVEPTDDGHFAVHGEAGPRAATLDLHADAVELAALRPYLAAHLVPRLQGRAAVDATLAWAAEPAALTVTVRSASVDDLRAVDVAPPAPTAPTASSASRATARAAPRGHEEPAVSWKRLEMADARIDVTKRQASVARIDLHAPRVQVTRGGDGRIDLAHWIPAPEAASAPGAGASRGPSSGPSSAVPWQVALGGFSVDDGRVLWRDDAAPGVRGVRMGPVLLEAQSLRLHVSAPHWPAPADVQLSASVTAPSEETATVPLAGRRPERAGTVDWHGQVGLSPLAVRGALRVEGFPLHAVGRYAGGRYPVAVAHADARWRGDVSLRQAGTGAGAGLAAQASGELQLADVHVFSRDPDTGAVSPDELLGWQSLALHGLKVAIAPSTRPRIDVREAVLSDLYAQLAISEQGRFNLRDATTAEGTSPAPPGGFAIGPEIAASAPEGGAASEPEPAPRETAPPPAAPGASSPSPSPSAAASGPAFAKAAKWPVDVGVGGIRLVNGRIDYTDRLIRPNYRAALSELEGTLGAFDSTRRAMTDLALRGHVAGTAQLDVHGRVDPGSDPPSLDINARTSDLDLAPLSPYAGKYIGYAIERGKLTMDVHYIVTPDGRLDASNHVIVDQLTFGERIDSPQATKMPVRLVVALLKDVHGVIDINLPVNGSLNDPHFHLGRVIFQVIGNLFAKIFTAPFALLTGGGTDTSRVAFDPGTATLAAGSAATLDQVAKALADRPGLQVTVTGMADPASEADAMRTAMLEQRLATLRRNQRVRAGAEAGPATEPVPAAERPALVRDLYRETSLPDKPRNWIGVAKDLPVADMEALLKRQLPVTEETARDLALQRGVAVRDALLARGLPAERLFLGAPQVRAANDGQTDWGPRAQLTLAAK